MLAHVDIAKMANRVVLRETIGLLGRGPWNETSRTSCSYGLT